MLDSCNYLVSDNKKLNVWFLCTYFHSNFKTKVLTNWIQCWYATIYGYLHNVYIICCSDFKPVLNALGLYFQIRDDYANLNSKEVRHFINICINVFSSWSISSYLPWRSATKLFLVFSNKRSLRKLQFSWWLKGVN